MKYSTSKPKMLLHICCANCAAYPITLLEDDFDIMMFFYNPNIHPYEEYFKRLDDVKKLACLSGIPLITGSYDNSTWSTYIKGFEDEPEGGKRCRECFDIRLEKTASSAKDRNMDVFATTLSISPHKNAGIINDVALSISQRLGIDYYISDLKKKNGFKKTNELSRIYDFYRQDYCGCIYSIKEDI